MTWCDIEGSDDSLMVVKEVRLTYGSAEGAAQSLTCGRYDQQLMCGRFDLHTDVRKVRSNS